MKSTKLVIPIATVLFGLALFAFEMWGQPAPVSRDPNIGAGLIGLAGIAIAALGVIKIILELIWHQKTKR